ncbi:MAG: FG-GAP-like repeat-containing protein [Gammaproteobacteria bacterium]|nr:FG-GAP-like repeat-containing protein [Gammaproteobacteria bacterium]
MKRSHVGKALQPSLVPVLVAAVVGLAAPAGGQPVAAGVIRSVVGGLGPDPGIATASWLHHADGVAVDRLGNVYLTDTATHRIRRVDASTGIIATVAGTGEQGFGGDGGPATEALLDAPEAVAVAGSGDLYIADTGNRRVRRVDGITGTIATVAGGGEHGIGRVWEPPPPPMPATDLRLGNPEGVAVDASGHVYVSDAGHHCLRRIDAGTGIATTVAGVCGYGGPIGPDPDEDGPVDDRLLDEPRGVAVAGSGDVFLADTGKHRLVRVDGTTGVATTLAELHPGRAHNCRFIEIDCSDYGYPLVWPADVAVAASREHLYFTSRGTDSVWRMEVAADTVTCTDETSCPFVRVAGGGEHGFGGDGRQATEVDLDPHGIDLGPYGGIYLAGGKGRRVLRVDAATGMISTVAGSDDVRDGGAATEAVLRYPLGIAVGPYGDVFVADTYNGRIRRMDAATGLIATAAGTGEEGWFGDAGAPAYPLAVAADARGDLYVAVGTHSLWEPRPGYVDRGAIPMIRRIDARTGAVSTVAGTGEWGFSGDGGPATEARFRSTAGFAVAASGDIYVADTGNARVRRVDARTGIVTTVAGTVGIGPADVAVAASGDVYIAGGNRVLRADAGTGAISTVAGTGEWGFSGDGGPATQARMTPWRVAVANSGDIYIVDFFDPRIRRVDADTGIVTTVAGTGRRGFGGDGRPSSFAWLHYPSDVAVAPSGEVLVADTGNHRVRGFAPPIPVPGQVGDLDDDGTDDVLLRRADGRWHFDPVTDRRVRRDEPPRKVRFGRGAAELPGDPAWGFVAIGDFDGRGGDEVLLRHEDGRWRLHPMAGRRAGGAPVELVGLPRDISLLWAGAGDFNGDGTDDILVRRDDGFWFHYAMDGLRVVADGSGRARVTRDLDYRPSAVGDFDGDGKDDVLVRRRDGNWYRYRMDGRGNAGRRARAGLPSDWGWRIAGVGDFDGDGVDDVYMRHFADGRWWFHAGAGRASAAARMTTSRDFHIAAAGDFNGDGRDDFLVRRLTTGHWFYYALDGARVEYRSWASLTREPVWTVAGGLP